MKLPITKPYITNDELEIVQEPLKSGWLVQGKFVKEFENKIAEFVGSKYAIAVNSCTSGQFLLSQILELNSDDEVILPAFTWVSTANSIEFFGAKPIFCDVDINSFNINVAKIESLITEKTKAIYPVNLFGLPAEMKKISEIANKHNLYIIEDSACGLGGFLNNKHCGTFGDAGVFSFHPRKSITTGEGGVVVTNNEQIYKKMKSLREHGAIKSDKERHEQNGGFLLTEYPYLGFNFRMTDIQAAVGCAQADKLDFIFKNKQKLAKRFDEEISKIDWLQAPIYDEKFTHGYQSYCCLFMPKETKKALAENDINKINNLHAKRNKVMADLERMGIATRQGTHAVHIQQYYREKYGYKPIDFIVSYAADRLSMSLPFYPQMNNEEISYLFESLRKIQV